MNPKPNRSKSINISAAERSRHKVMNIYCSRFEQIKTCLCRVVIICYHFPVVSRWS